MEERRACLCDRHDDGCIVADDREESSYRFKNEFVMPIISQGDPVGAVIVCGNDVLNDADKKVVQSAAGVMGRQMEQ